MTTQTSRSPCTTLHICVDCEASHTTRPEHNVCAECGGTTRIRIAPDPFAFGIPTIQVAGGRSAS